MEALDKAIAWQTAEPIRVDRPGSPGHGGILHGIDTRRGQPLGLYTEITGYAVSLFTFLLRIGRVDIQREAAMEAADYLVSIQDETGAYPHLPDPAERHGAWSAYSFDVAACIVGLARLHGLCPGKGYLDSAALATRWLLGLQRPDGSFCAMMVKGGGLRDPGGFFGDGSCIHAKNAIALLEMHAATGREEYRQAASKVCERTLSLQAPDGAFWSGPAARYVFSHAHAYACEGLLYAGIVLGEQRFCDAAAQAARLFRLEGSRFGGTDHDASRRSAIDFLLRCQDAGGGFHYRRTRFGLSPFMSTWSAQFAAQALAWDSAPASVGDLF